MINRVHHTGGGTIRTSGSTKIHRSRFGRLAQSWWCLWLVSFGVTARTSIARDPRMHLSLEKHKKFNAQPLRFRLCGELWSGRTMRVVLHAGGALTATISSHNVTKNCNCHYAPQRWTRNATVYSENNSVGKCPGRIITSSIA